MQKDESWYADSNLMIKNGGVTKLVKCCRHVNLKLRVFLRSYSVAMITSYGTIVIKTCWRIDGHSFDTTFMDTCTNETVP